MSELIDKIRQAFEDAYRKHGEPNVRNINASPAKIKIDLETYGIAVIKDPISEKDWEQYLLIVACEISEHLFGVDDPFQNPEFCKEFELMKKFSNNSTGMLMLRTFGKWWNSSNGFGNSNFRFLFYQYQEKPPHFKVGEEDIVYSYNPYYQHGLRLLATEPGLWEILKSFHPPGKAMVSWDSVKVRVNHPKSTKPALTKRHRDVYNIDGQPIDRKQAMLIKQEPGAISLGWVIYSQLPKIQKLLAAYFGKEPDRFSSVEDPELNEIFDKYWRGTTDSFVIWEQQTIHYEACPKEEIGGITKFKSFSQPRETSDLISIRAVIGTHQPYSLNKKEQKQLAYLAEQGYCPAVYNNPNRGKAVSTNTVNKKSTQWRKTRTPNKQEKLHLKKTEDGYLRYDSVVSKLDPVIREMYGLY